MRKHIVLIGLPGSGKSTVGRLVAERLSAGFVDIDAIILRREGKPIATIFAEQGEAVFRNLERREMETALAKPPAVIAPGGGWAAQAGALDGVRDSALTIYLRTSAETAAQHAVPELTRPLLIGEDPVARMRLLLKEREPFYLKAHAKLDTDRQAAEQVASEVVRLAQSSAGW